MTQWWEPSPLDLTKCGPGSNPGVDAIKGCVCCLFSPLLREIFLWVLRFSALIKSQSFQIPIWPWMAGKNQHVDVLPQNDYLLPQSYYLYTYLLIDCFIYICYQLPVKATRSSKPSLFHSCHFWRRDVIYFNFLSSQVFNWVLFYIGLCLTKSPWHRSFFIIPEKVHNLANAMRSILLF